MEARPDMQDTPSRGGPVFQVGDRVKKRPLIGDSQAIKGTVVAVNGRWIHVKHDVGSKRGGAVNSVPPRYDYLAEDLEHINPLLRVAQFL